MNETTESCACCGAPTDEDCTCDPVCPACGDGHDDPCACVDCGSVLCAGCAVGGRCDSCDCDFSAEEEA